MTCYAYNKNTLSCGYVRIQIRRSEVLTRVFQVAKKKKN